MGAGSVRGHPNDPDEVRRKLVRNSRGLTEAERRELMEMLDQALQRIASGREGARRRAAAARDRAMELSEEAKAVRAQSRQTLLRAGEVLEETQRSAAELRLASLEAVLIELLTLDAMPAAEICGHVLDVLGAASAEAGGARHEP
jgi:hypothetical protein